MLTPGIPTVCMPAQYAHACVAHTHIMHARVIHMHSLAVHTDSVGINSDILTAAKGTRKVVRNY